jgi:hypothetical protein
VQDTDLPEPGDTLVFRDSTRAVVVKIDSDSDRLEVRGVEIEALQDGARLVELKVWTEVGDLKSSTDANSRNYPVAVLFEGSFTKAPNVRATACKWASSMPDSDLRGPCARMQLYTVSRILNGEGEWMTASASIPCKDKNASPSPCSSSIASDIGWYYRTGTFRAIDADRFSCILGCQPTHELTIFVTYMLAGEKLSLTDSALAAMSGRPEEDLGVEEVFSSLSDKLSGDYWVWFSAADEEYRAVPYFEKSYKLDASSIPVRFGLQRARRVRATDGVSLISIGTTAQGRGADSKLPPREQARNQRSYASYIAEKDRLRWKEVSRIKLDYDYVVDGSDPEDPRIGKEIGFDDCQNGSFYVLVKLAEAGGKNPQQLHIYLGAEHSGLSKCFPADLSKKNLVKEDKPRVQMPDGSYVNVEQSQAGAYGGLFVRSISIVVDQGREPGTRKNYKVELRDANINGSHANRDLYRVDTESFVDIPQKELPAGGASVVMTNVTGDAPYESLQYPSLKFTAAGQELQATMKVSDLPGAAPNAEYRANLCLSGGRCVPLQGKFVLEP